MIKEAIILAGGLGTRLKSAVPDLPKCMAPVAGKPFIEHLLHYLQQQGVDKFILCLGYKHEIIEAYINEHHPLMYVQFAVEEELLGTGGAVKAACSLAYAKNVLVLNGDTIFKADIAALSSFHLKQKASCTLSLKPMQHFDRYGIVEINEDSCITDFREKQSFEKGLINAGVYALNREQFLKELLPEKFSFEKDYLEQFFKIRKFRGFVQDGYFIDIGIPADYERASIEYQLWK